MPSRSGKIAKNGGENFPDDVYFCFGFQGLAAERELASLYRFQHNWLQPCVTSVSNQRKPGSVENPPTRFLSALRQRSSKSHQKQERRKEEQEEEEGVMNMHFQAGAVELRAFNPNSTIQRLQHLLLLAVLAG